MNNYKLLNNIFGWLTFAISATVYLITMEPTGSFWDCGEFIAAAYKLMVGHPPGAPMFMLLGNLFTQFADPSDPSSVARAVNALSGVMSAFTILFLFWTITAIARKIVLYTKEELTQANIIAITGSGLVGALAYTFSDTFWFSAVEGEVYATSSMFTALVVWLIFKWDQKVEDGDIYADRYLILIAYFVGISIGVHLLNLLCIPAIGYVYYFRQTKKYTTGGFILAGIISFAVLLFIQYGVIPGFVTLAAKFELMAVNTMGLPFNSGIYIYCALVVGLLIGGIAYTRLRNKVNANTALIALATIFIGYSSYAVILIRSNANTVMNENEPSNAFALLSYLNRDQYGDRPLFYGQYYNARVTGYKDGSPTYYKDFEKNKYMVGDDGKNSKPEYDPKFSTILPRMWSSDHADEYRSWAGIKGPKSKKPTFGQNLTFLYDYQIRWMWIRYFLWNFSGRQNDIQGSGGPDNGNWITGIGFIDSLMYGDQETLPESLKNNKGRNAYFMLPLFLGLLGLVYTFSKDRRQGWVILLMFVFMGIFINMYLNPTPSQPRERDYAYVGSFYAFSIWVGLGVMGLFDLISKYLKGNAGAAIATSIGVLAAPVLMATQNWDDHDRSNRYTSRDIARNYLDSCEPNAILFTNGDNDTFPLWYVQEVEGYRTDVRVVNLSLLNTDWYINQMKRQVYNSAPVPFSLPDAAYRQGTRDYVLVNAGPEDTVYTDIKRVLALAASNETLPLQNGEKVNFINTNKLYIGVNKEKVLANGTVPQKFADKIQPIYWDLGKRFVLYKKDLMILDLLANNNWERPVYFAVTVGGDSYLGLEKYFMQTGLCYKIVPMVATPVDGQDGMVDTDKMYTNLIEKFQWGNMNDPNVYLDETNMRMTMNFRNNFARLATALYVEGKKDKAIKTLDKCVEVMPNNAIPYDFMMINICALYYTLAEKDKAFAILNTIKDRYTKELTYYKGLDKSTQKLMATDAYRAESYLERITRLETEMKTKTPDQVDFFGLKARTGRPKLPEMAVDTPNSVAGDTNKPVAPKQDQDQGQGQQQ